ncbi:MAG: tetratricopeptide repeat protein [Thermoflexibacter sp.]|jgi:tetratricopeptide (TPR) repeat protein|nr:tetratricopeptide repeat protein [Thermoflexibacter sp.]
MKKINLIAGVCVYFCLTQFCFGQGFVVPENYEFKTKDDYQKYEYQIIDCINWLENTPLDQETDKRKDAGAFLIKWITGSPSVSIELREDLVGFMKTNPELLLTYMGGYTKFMLENKGSNDVLQATMVAVQSVIKVYKKGIGIKKDKSIENFIKMDEKGELKQWLAAKVGITDRLNRDEGMYNSSKSAEARAFYNEGFTYAKNGDFNNAIESYRKAIAIDRRYVEAYDNIGVAFRRLNMLDSAEHYYLQSIKLYPKGAMARQNLGLVYQIKKEYEKALEQYRAIQDINPEGPEGVYGMAQTYLNMGDFDKAIEAGLKAEKIYEKNKDPWIADAHVLLGIAYFESGKKSKGKSYLKKAIEAGVKLSPQQKKYYELD